MIKRLMIACMLGLTLTGCGINSSKQILDTFDEANDVTENKETDDDKVQDEKGKPLINNKIQYTAISQSTNATMEVDAEYEEFPREGLNVYSVVNEQVTNEVLFDLAGKYFDNGVYEVRKPSDYMKPEKVNQEMNEIDEQLKQLENNDVVGGMTASEHFYLYGFPDESADIQKTDRGDAFLEWRETIPEENLDYYMTLAQLQGKIDGDEWIMCFHKTDIYDSAQQQWQRGFGRICMYNKVAHPCKMEYQEIVGDNQSSYYGDNLSDYDKALKKATACVKALGFDQYEMKKQEFAAVDAKQHGIVENVDEIITNAFDGDNPGNAEMVANGYRFSFAPVVDGIPINVDQNKILTTEKVDILSMNDERTEQPYIEVSVDDTGIYHIEIGNLYNMTEKTATDVKTMDFKKADENVRAALESEYTDYFTVDKIRAEYRIVKYEENYAMVPVWVYYSNFLGTNEYAVLAVNAIDGSVYYLQSNLMDVIMK